tara:strand:+ start:18118 stop:19287 length:1170 start_codon:yes stop_codon:yes gene_type:complete
MKKITHSILLLFIVSITNSCVEEFNAATVEFEDAIVIEATITNEFKYQKILLSRTHKLEKNNPSPESDATIKITSGSNNTYTFHETEPGIYMSDIQFNAQPSSNYQLSVTASSGEEYTSQPTELTSNTSVIENVYAIRETSEDGVDGITIYVDSFDLINSSRYYGFEFEETYQIIAPRWVPNEYVYIPATLTTPETAVLVPRTQEERVCFATINSQGRLTTNTNLLSEDRISKFPIKFIPLDDIRISSRYSILLKQHTQSAESYNFYETLNNLSSSESLLSQNQPGFLAGNIFSINNPNEKVLGFFEVSSVKQKRAFFNRSDYTNVFFWDAWYCKPFELDSNLNPFEAPFISLIRNKRISYFSQKKVVLRACGDCTQLGSNIRPSFWID